MKSTFLLSEKVLWQWDFLLHGPQSVLTCGLIITVLWTLHIFSSHLQLKITINLKVQHLGPDAMEGYQTVGSRVMRKLHTS